MPKHIKYSRELLAEAASNSFSIAGVLRHLNLKQAGGNQAHISRRLKEYEIDTLHFTGCSYNRGKTPPNRKTATDILVLLPAGSFRPKRSHLRRAMLECGMTETCYSCGNGTEWNGKKLVLHVDHIDGDWLNNVLTNLRFLCPNCHTQTETYGTRNKPSYSNW